MKRGYEHCNHEKYLIRYHIIFSTKYRKKCLKNISEDIKKYMKRAELTQDKWKIEIMEIDKDKCDHIHFLIRSTPTCRVSEIVKILKQISTYDSWKYNREELKKYYWKGPHHLWTRGYFCSSIGEVSEKTLYNYIKSQG